MECCYAETKDGYFAAPFTLGKQGLESSHSFGSINDYEKGRIEEAKQKLQGDVKVGLDFISSKL